MAHTYNANFTANAIVAQFDVNQSGYGETNDANTNIRMIPWSGASNYAIVAQVGGLNPHTRTYQVTVYAETDYGALRSLVGQQGMLTTPREGSPSPATPQQALLTSVKRGNFQYPNWPYDTVSFLGDGVDLQTLVLDFVMLQD